MRTWETDMKLSVAVIVILSTVLLYPSSGFSQRRQDRREPGAGLQREEPLSRLPRSSRNNAAPG